jgi:hypothetical protein
MISERTLTLAVEQGLLTPDQVAALCAIEAKDNPLAPSPDDEQLRFITGFADIFVTIGIALFLGGMVFLMADQPVWAQAAAVAAASWGLAEFFTRRRRMALPSIVLLLTFTAGAGIAVLMFLAGDFKTLGDYGRSLFFGDATHLPAMLAADFTCVAAAALHYWRFGVPITVAAGGAGLTATILSLLAYAAPGLVFSMQRPLIFACGVLFFVAAMAFDRRDLRRQTRLSDIAFWLHMLSAPLLVHSLAGYFARSLMLTLNAALLILAIFVVLGLVAILIDRRALLVSGLLYLAIAFSSVIRETALSNAILPLTVLGLGAFILLISAAWQPLRRVVLALVPDGLARWVPPARASSSG